MKISKALILLISLILLPTSDILAQSTSSAAQTAEHLRTQLRDVQAEEAELQARSQQLDWELRPENIERYFSATGSTRPEELRELRRRQLQHEKEGVSKRLTQLAASRMRLDAAIGAADAESYRQSAEGHSGAWLNQTLGTQYFGNTLLSAGIFALIAIVCVLALVAVIRRRRRILTGASRPREKIF